jgi:hypothetical protein
MVLCQLKSKNPGDFTLDNFRPVTTDTAKKPKRMTPKSIMNSMLAFFANRGVKVDKKVRPDGDSGK